MSLFAYKHLHIINGKHIALLDHDKRCEGRRRDVRISRQRTIRDAAPLLVLLLRSLRHRCPQVRVACRRRDRLGHDLQRHSRASLVRHPHTSTRARDRPRRYRHRVALLRWRHDGLALAWSNALKESAARTIVLRWGGMLVVGGFFGTFLHFGKLGVLKTVWRNCIDLSGTPLTAASRLAVPSTSFNCTYACFSATPSSIREASETIVQKYNSNDRNWSFWLWMGSAIISYVLGLFAMAGNVDAHSGHPSWSPFMHHLSAGIASLSCVLVIVSTSGDRGSALA
ncbi:hypothetical protein B0H14DRAFT_318149 [Mycena olivaceomarginata]|nr:hypothetical protein B0H14DRAFT_318149 [Mycena olivaceomarginata]